MLFEWIETTYIIRSLILAYEIAVPNNSIEKTPIKIIKTDFVNIFLPRYLLKSDTSCTGRSRETAISYQISTLSILSKNFSLALFTHSCVRLCSSMVTTDRSLTSHRFVLLALTKNYPKELNSAQEKLAFPKRAAKIRNFFELPNFF